MPLFALNYPSNTLMFYQIINSIASFDIFPSYIITDKVFSF
jgi:hypothetical protein